MDDSGLLGKLTEETFNQLETSELKMNDDFKFSDPDNVVFANFTTKNRKFLIEGLLDFVGGLSIQEAKLNLKSMCYQFVINGFEVDIPSNWSVFNIVEDYKAFHLKSGENSELLDVLKLIMDVSADDFLIIKSRSSIKIIGFKNQNSTLREAIENLYNLEIQLGIAQEKKIQKKAA
jgi:hypothetical protein